MSPKRPQVSSDLTFLTNEAGYSLRERLAALLAHARLFDCLVGYFYASGFYKLSGLSNLSYPLPGHFPHFLRI
jgi:hypothetical protein